ncbi:MAG: FHA domain-containing protein [Deltaproteobacteria bacterium]|nr:FHA domain-containing protein [Deltaproteobacteria bacterium]MDZ4224890.1 FHA domain-containing protein [bacterium]
MAQEKTANTAGYEFPFNQKLLEEALKLKEERRILKERLNKIESNKTDVSSSVFQKVHNDYATRLQNITDRLLEKKGDIDRELGTLYETRNKIEANLKNHKEAHEEVQFRHKLGEFTREEFQKLSKEQEDKVTRFEQVMAGVKTNIQRYESLFEGDEDIFGEDRLEESPVRIEEEVDEWEKEAMEAEAESNTSPTGEVAESVMGKQDWMENTKPGVAAAPQITIIAGAENVGKTYSVAGTLSIGRSHTNQIILKDAKASRQHAEIRLQGNECVLVDLNSSNGSLVNGQRVHEHILSPNDEIQIGDFVMQFHQ